MVYRLALFLCDVKELTQSLAWLWLWAIGSLRAIARHSEGQHKPQAIP